MRMRRLVGLKTEQKPLYQSYWENLTGKAAGYKNPITGTKDYMKWWIIKIVGGLFALKIAFANAHHLFAPRRQEPQVVQSQISGQTELQLKQMEKEILELKLSIEKEKN